MTDRPTSTKPRTPGAEQVDVQSTYSSTFPQRGESEPRYSAWRVPVALTYADGSTGIHSARVFAFTEENACIFAEQQAYREALNADELLCADAGEAVPL